MTNVLRPVSVGGTDQDYARVEGSERVRRLCGRYLHDESRLEAALAEVVHFPASVEQVAAALRSARRRGRAVVVSGGRTGITGGAVPPGCQEILSVERLSPRPVLKQDASGAWRVFGLGQMDKFGSDQLAASIP